MDEYKNLNYTTKEINEGIELGYLHDANTEIHITQTEREQWNAKAPASAVEEIAAVANQAAINCAALGLQRKNLLKNTATTATKNGVTFTVNADGSVTATGTATANTNFDIAKKELSAGAKYTLSGCPSGGTENTYNLYALYTANWAGIGGRDNGDGFTFTAKEGELVFRIYVTSGTVINNVTFSPMLRYADISDATFEQYTPSAQEQIDALAARISALENAVGGYV